MKDLSPEDTNNRQKMVTVTTCEKIHFIQFLLKFDEMNLNAELSNTWTLHKMSWTKSFYIVYNKDVLRQRTKPLLS